MRTADSLLRVATSAVEEHGCPICGDDSSFYFIDCPNKISMQSCGHSFRPYDAIQMERIQYELQGEPDDGEEI